MSRISLKDFLSTCQTGDIILFSSNYWYSKLIERFSSSKFSHIGVILKDPTYINDQLKGLYVWESGAESKPDPEDNSKKIGVQITPLNDILEPYKGIFTGSVYYRKLNCIRNKEFVNKLIDIHHIVHGKPYDTNILDWIKGQVNIDHKCDDKDLGDDHKTNEFWCSALTGFIYSKLGFINDNIPWTIVAPKQFSYYEKECLTFINCIVDPEKYIEL